MDFARVLAELSRFLQAQRVRFGVAGAVALQAHGISRATTDLDLVVEESAKPALLQFIDSLGYERLLVSEGFSNHLHPDPEWGRVDLIYLDSHTAGILFASAVKTRFGNLEILAPSPEHLAAMKAQAIKNNPARLLKDLADVQSLLRVPGIDRAKVRRYFERHGLAAKFDELVGRD
jgi:hypothetical protein